MSGAEQPASALHLVLVHDRAGIAMRQAMLVGEPVGTFVTAQERGARLEAPEPLSEVTSGDRRDAGDQVLVHLRRVGQRQVAPPGARGGVNPFSVETAPPQRA